MFLKLCGKHGYTHTLQVAVVALILVVTCWSFLLARVNAQSMAALHSANTKSASEDRQDPNKPASEQNHRLAGCALVAIGMLVIASHASASHASASHASGKPGWLQRIWPFLFVAAGLFLAIWSDGEIWPRGKLSWIWLIHHDAEARQHKIYAILLIAIGTVEYLRVNAKLARFWRIWAFPLLALCGTVLLLFHDHTSGSGATSAEAQNYLVSWLPSATDQPVAPLTADSTGPPATIHHRDHTLSESTPIERPGAEPATIGRSIEMDNMEMDNMEMDHGGSGHQHHMTAAMLKVEHQHQWFALIGIAVVLFKFLNDSAVWRRSFVPLLWPTCISVLGMLLIFYTE
jgi:hypothetical protein